MTAVKIGLFLVFAFVLVGASDCDPVGTGMFPVDPPPGPLAAADTTVWARAIAQRTYASLCLIGGSFTGSSISAPMIARLGEAPVYDTGETLVMEFETQMTYHRGLMRIVITPDGLATINRCN